MNADFWRQAESLYHSALERPPAERADFLRETCADPVLREEVQSLLELHSATGALDRPAWEARPATGQRIGPYLVEGRIGAGGMGEVWRALDTRLGRKVAIKVSTTSF